VIFYDFGLYRDFPFTERKGFTDSAIAAVTGLSGADIDKRNLISSPQIEKAG